MNLLTQQFQNQKLFIGYLTAGDGGIDFTYSAALALINGGVDILEIGIPFSDPIADGPTIQQAMQRALSAGTTLQDILTLVDKIKSIKNIPIILFSYLNPILQAKRNNFLELAKSHNVDGLLIVDLPMEESHDLVKQIKKNNLTYIPIITPNTSPTRLKQICQDNNGFLYYACRKGTTGTKDDLPNDLSAKISDIKNMTHLPIAVGFGIGQKETAKKILSLADGFVVGSKFVSAIAQGASADDLKQLAHSIDPR